MLKGTRELLPTRPGVGGESEGASTPSQPTARAPRVDSEDHGPGAQRGDTPHSSSTPSAKRALGQAVRIFSDLCSRRTRHIHLRGALVRPAEAATIARLAGKSPRVGVHGPVAYPPCERGQRHKERGGKEARREEENKVDLG